MTHPDSMWLRSVADPGEEIEPRLLERAADTIDQMEAEIHRLTAALAEAEAAIAEARMDGIEDMRQRGVQFCIDRAKRQTSTERGLAVLEIADQLQDV